MTTTNNKSKMPIQINNIPSLDDLSLLKIKPENYGSTTAETIGLMINKQYSIKDLEFIVENFAVSLTAILYTQKLTAEFCIKYMLRDDEYYCITDMDGYICNETILYHQPHLSQDDLKVKY